MMAEEVEMTPIGEDEMPPKAAPFGAAPAAPAPATPAPATVSTIKLKPVIRKPVIRKTPAPGAIPAPPAAAAAAPAASLKSVTGPIPAQATLRKTGIIAEGILTPAQQQAAKSKTSRISLESAIGVAPTTSKGPAPMKTIRLRRPSDLNKPAAASPFRPKPPDASSTATTVVAGQQPSAIPAAPEASPVADMTPVGAGELDSTVTQKKTLKLHRPAGGGMTRPKIGMPAAEPAAGGGEAGVADLGSVSDGGFAGVAMAPVAIPESSSAGVPGWLLTITTVASVAALLVLGAVFYYLFTEGCAPVANDNTIAFIAL